MSQQAKDIYSGIKKIFPSSRRSSSSFSFVGRSSSHNFDLDAALSADGQHAEPQQKPARKKKERGSSFSFSGWKEKHRASSSVSESSDSHTTASSSRRASKDEKVVMSLPYGATAATPKGKAPELDDGSSSMRNSITSTLNSAFHTAPSRGSLFGSKKSSTTAPDSDASRKQRSSSTIHASDNNNNNTGSRSSRNSRGSRSSRHSRNSVSSTGSGSGASTPHSAFSTTSFDLPTQPPKLTSRSVSVGNDRPCSGPRSGRTSGVHGDLGLDVTPGMTLGSHSLTSYSRVKNVNSATYHANTNSISKMVKRGEPLTAPSSASSVDASGPGRPQQQHRHSFQPQSLQQFPQPRPVNYDGRSVQSNSSSTLPIGGAAVLSPTKLQDGKKPRGKKERGMSLSFTSSKKKEKKVEEEKAAQQTQIQPDEQAKPLSRAEKKKLQRERQRQQGKDDSAVVKPHASTWDSDSDDDYEDSARPTRGLDRRSQSMDFMEQAPTHLISKIWRKLPIQAKLIGGRGSIDLDLQKDRTSFSRSSEAKKLMRAAEKAAAAEKRRRTSSERTVSSPQQKASSEEDEALDPHSKRTRFSLKLTFYPSDANGNMPGAYTLLESYDDVLVRVCGFASHDQRPTSTKVQEFLERSMAFLHGTRTKHGNVVSISNEEIRMWRRLARHDWALEEVTTVAAAKALGVQGIDVQAPSSRTSSSVTEGTDSDSDNQQTPQRHTQRRLQSVALSRSLSESVAEEEPEEEEDEDLDVPEDVKLDPLRRVINCCVNFGERLFTTPEVSKLVHLQFLVEEDGWI